MAIERYSMNCGGTLPILDLFSTYTITITGTYNNNPVSNTQNLIVNNIYGNQTQSPTFIYNMYHFLSIMNTAFTNCFSQIQNSISGYSILTKPPFIDFDNSTNLFQIYTDNTGFGTIPSSSNESFNIIFNNDLFNLLRNFNFNIDNLNNATLNISTSPFDIVSINSLNWTKNKQLFNSTSLWSPVRDIQFLTNLPISFEQYGDVSVLGSFFNLGDNFQSTQDQVLTDITIDNVVNEWNEHIVYNSTKYRWVNMNAVKDLKDIKIYIFWNHKNGTKYNLLLPNFSNIELKLLFRRKL
jgi:hypothetical protein